ncbi:hypothetical protein [Pontibacter litorisediminis]|uniref:hypothetical protein n=1 Tax=Pontibacter litorisediminis TaxID=1846260 RepID=UPI0023EB79D3|nr:hypothetical protein [Pontibacter litorisediminis]
MLVAGIPVAAAISYLLVATGVVTDSRTFFDAWTYPMIYFPIILGLALLVFSEEHQEDEMVQSLRYKAFVSGVFFLVMALLWLPFFSIVLALVRGRSIGMPDAGGMLGALFLLLVYICISFKYNLYYTRKAPEADEE